MLDDILEIRKIRDLSVYFRISDKLIFKNQPKELEEMILFFKSYLRLK